MLYDVCISGEITNIQGLVAEQTLSVILKCTLCNEIHGKHVVVSYESIKREDDTGTFNMIMACRSCKRRMKASVVPPKLVFVECTDSQTGADASTEAFLCMHGERGFRVSGLRTVGCVLVDAVCPAIDVLSTQGAFFRRISIDSDCWAGTSHDGVLSSIDALKVVLYEAK